MLTLADFDEAFSSKPVTKEKIPCNPPECFVGSYAPVAQPGKEGKFFVNTYLLQPNRQAEVAGPVPIRSKDFKCRN